MSSNQLEPISPREAGNFHVENKRSDNAAHQTIEKYEDVLDHWYDFTDENSIENLNNTSGRDLLVFRQWLEKNTDNNKVSINGLLAILRVHIKFCEQIEAVTPGLHEKVPMPVVSDDEDVCYDKPTEKQVSEILDFLRNHEPCSRRRVEFELIRETMIRRGALRGIDVSDVNLDEQYIKLRHRPVEERDVLGTPLKNGINSERRINIPDYACELIRGYLNSPNRPDIVDQFGRKPLLTTKHGRVKGTTIQRDLYKIMRPCEYNGNCPHERNIASCDATKAKHASKCPSTYSPHPLRRYAIEDHISGGMPKEHICDRADVSLPVLNEHYDLRSEEKRREDRKRLLTQFRDGYDTDTDIANQPAQSASAENDSTGSRDQIDDNQSRFSEFTWIISQPVLVPVLTVGVTINWVPDRLQREHKDLSPTNEPQWPTRGRIIQGGVAYSLFVALAAVNLILLEAVPAPLT